MVLEVVDFGSDDDATVYNATINIFIVHYNADFVVNVDIFWFVYPNKLCEKFVAFWILFFVH